MNIIVSIFVAISVLLVAAIYSSSLSIEFASGLYVLTNMVCNVDQGGKTGWCCGSNGEKIICYDCKENADDTWSCEKATTESPPPGIKDAIVKAHAGAVGGGATTGENNTHITNGNIVKSGGILKGGGTSGDNQGTRNGNTNCMQNCTLQ